MQTKMKNALLASGVSMALSVYQFLLFADFMERLARLLPGMKGLSGLFLIIAAGVGELAFIYTRYPHYRNGGSLSGLMRRFLSVTLVQAYLLVAFVPIRLIVFANVFGIPMHPAIFETATSVDIAIFCAAMVLGGTCHAARSMISVDS